MQAGTLLLCHMKRRVGNKRLTHPTACDSGFCCLPASPTAAIDSSVSAGARGLTSRMVMLVTASGTAGSGPEGSGSGSGGAQGMARQRSQ
jgi:hypothetical protein